MNINLHTWFSERKINFLPAHFISTNAEINDERHLWVLENLVGRYYIGPKKGGEDFLSLFYDSVIYFEDSKEALFYDLKWS